MTSSNDEMSIIPAKSHHLDAMCKIECQVSPFPWTRAEFAQSLQDHCSYVLIAGNRVRGFVIFLRVIDEVELLNIAVQPTFQGAGLGRWLLDFLIDEVKSGAIKIYLEVRASNIPAICLYLDNGFQQTGIRRAYYHAEHGREDALQMCRELALLAPRPQL